MSKIYSHQKTTDLQKKIATFAQMKGEHLHEVWDRFKQLLMECPCITILYNCKINFLLWIDTQYQYMVHNTTKGAMEEKTTEETVELYEMLGANFQ